MKSDRNDRSFIDYYIELNLKHEQTLAEINKAIDDLLIAEKNKHNLHFFNRTPKQLTDRLMLLEAAKRIFRNEESRLHYDETLRHHDKGVLSATLTEKYNTDEFKQGLVTMINNAHTNDYYALLKLNSDASEEQIRDAIFDTLQTLSQAEHYVNESRLKSTIENLKDVIYNNVWPTLLDPKLRDEYNSTRIGPAQVPS